MASELINLSMSYATSNLELLLQNKAIVPVYRLFCCTLNLEDYVDLYLDILEFKSTYSPESNALPSKPIEKAAKEIYDKYFGPDTFTEVNVPASVLEHTLSSIDSKCDESVFKEIHKVIFVTLKEKSLVAFTENPAYLNFLSLFYNLQCFSFESFYNYLNIIIIKRGSQINLHSKGSKRR